MNVVFIVPLKAKEISENWPMTQSLCLRAVYSMLNGGENARVILVCSTPPDELPRDSRLRVIEEDFGLPKGPQERKSDKWLKIRRGLIEARPLAPCWIVRADADDCVSSRLVPFVVNQGRNIHWIAENGYVANDVNAKVFSTIPNFHLYCGTSSIIYVNATDINDADFSENDGVLLTQGHTVIADYLQRNKRDVRSIPFRAFVYVTGIPESNSGGNRFFDTMNSRCWTLHRLFHSRPVTARLREEFSFTTV